MIVDKRLFLFFKTIVNIIKYQYNYIYYAYLEMIRYDKFEMGGVGYGKIGRWWKREGGEIEKLPKIMKYDIGTVLSACLQEL